MVYQSVSLEKRNVIRLYNGAILIMDFPSCGHSEGNPKWQYKEAALLLSMKKVGKGPVLLDPEDRGVE